MDFFIFLLLDCTLLVYIAEYILMQLNVKSLDCAGRVSQAWKDTIVAGKLWERRLNEVYSFLHSLYNLIFNVFLLCIYSLSRNQNTRRSMKIYFFVTALPLNQQTKIQRVIIWKSCTFGTVSSIFLLSKLLGYYSLKFWALKFIFILITYWTF